MSKPTKTIDELIALLQSRNMSFRDIEAAYHFLANISYYRLKDYCWEMQDDFVNHHFRDGSYFEDALELYNFDRHFRLLVFNAIERIEIALRSKLIHHLSLSYGPEWYLFPSIFDKPKEYSSFLSIIYGEMRRSREEFMINHFRNHTKEHPESWKALEVLSLGTLSKLFQNIKHQSPEKSAIAKEFGLYNQKHLASWLLTITLVRNIIAHHGRLWNRVLINKYEWPVNTPTPILSYIPDDEQRKKIFSLLSAILYMNNIISPGHHIKEELINLFEQFPVAQLSKMGFPDNWKSEPIWK